MSDVNISRVKDALETSIFGSNDNLLPERSLQNCVTHLTTLSQNLNKLYVNVTTGKMTENESKTQMESKDNATTESEWPLEHRHSCGFFARKC